MDLAAVEAFLGRIGDPRLAAGATAPKIDAGMRAVMFTDIVGSTELTARLGDAGALELVHVHDVSRSGGCDQVGCPRDSLVPSLGHTQCTEWAQPQTSVPRSGPRSRTGPHSAQPLRGVWAIDSIFRMLGVIGSHARLTIAGAAISEAAAKTRGGHSESYDGVNVKPSSIQPVTPPIIIFTGKPSRARHNAALLAPLQCGLAQ